MKINNIQNGQIYRDFSFKNNPKEVKTQDAKPSEKAPIEKKPKSSNFPVILSTIAGTVLPMLVIRKYQGKTLKAEALKGLTLGEKGKAFLKSFNIEYGLKEMLFNSYGSVLGGLAGGLLFKKDEKKKPKIKEAVFQAVNITIPTSFAAFLLKQTEKNKNLKGVLPKIASVLIGLGVGMPVAAIVSDKISNSIIDKNNPSKRKLKLKDLFIHADDIIAALALSKIPYVEKVLPVLYGICGYEVGVDKD